MQLLEIKQKVTNNRLVIELPGYLNNQDVTVTISSNLKEEWSTLPSEKKMEILKAFAGSDKYPNNKAEDYDVYDQ